MAYIKAGTLQLAILMKKSWEERKKKKDDNDEKDKVAA
jgi:hypothetical protein